jgi:hypothetical protein
MQQYRIDNQGLFDRNYMPHMLGWYLLAEKTTLAEMEWMLARAAGYNAGFAMVASPEALRKNELTPQLLDAIREWEAARNGHAFSKAQQDRLKDPANEFHLEKISEGKWNLSQYQVSPLFVREKFIRQPGEPTNTSFHFNQLWKQQPLQFRLVIAGKDGSVNNLSMQVDNYTGIIIPGELAAGESVVCDGTATLRVYDKNGKPKTTITLSGAPPVIATGEHTIVIDNGFKGAEPPTIELQLKGLSLVETVKLVD